MKRLMMARRSSSTAAAGRSEVSAATCDALPRR